MYNYSQLFSRAALFFIGAAVAASTDELITSCISRDVVIVGGGSSGTYAAIRLLQQGFSVAVVERKPALGGHVNTFFDPETGTTLDYGVIGFPNLTVLNNYFEYLGVSTSPLGGRFGNAGSLFADFAKDGKAVAIPASIPWSDQTAAGLALAEYGQQIGRFPFLPNGFDLPTPIPDDLLLPFGDFLEKYDLGAFADIAITFNQGAGNILALSTLYNMKYFSESTVQAILGAGLIFVTTADQNNQAIYDKAASILGDAVFLNSNISRIERHGHGVHVEVVTPSGEKQIIAKKLVISIPPKIESLQGLGLDLSAQESYLFGQFNNSYYWDMVIRNSGIPDNVTFSNVDISAPLGIPPLPGAYAVDSTGLPGIHTAYYGSPHYLSDEEVKADVLQTLARIVEANGYNSTATPEFVGFNNHSPFELTVSDAAVKAGFYDAVNALQGQRDTWWTGATWQSQNSAEIWNWTEYNLLPKIVASL
ncbi:flavin-containing superfamily amine oxidase [Pleurostoma richardsiae]|uniref:Flavin-containing superfamily amine oxidase n=1 Tax=Pleurostoma richardsiae TaxID=41990 RepID=A0AA38R8V4_9PEZI|nr:flavin-containing superfamily amine oxidase [Pleurostoma richardsiae]